jgi:hypothetical protein
MPRATSHTRLKVCDHCQPSHPRPLVGWTGRETVQGRYNATFTSKCLGPLHTGTECPWPLPAIPPKTLRRSDTPRDRPRPLHTGSKEFINVWKVDMDSCHGRCWVMLCALLELASRSFPRGGFDANFGRVRRCHAFGWELRALTITWSGPLAHVWSGPKVNGSRMVNFSGYSTSPRSWNTRLVRDGWQIQIVATTTFLILFGAHMSIWFIIKVKIFVLVKWSFGWDECEWTSLYWKSLKYKPFPSNINNVTYNVDLQCYLLWVGIYESICLIQALGFRIVLKDWLASKHVDWMMIGDDWLG